MWAYWQSVPAHWREIPARYRLEGGRCKDCGYTMLPKEDVCPVCGSTRRTMTYGTTTIGISLMSKRLLFHSFPSMLRAGFSPSGRAGPPGAF